MDRGTSFLALHLYRTVYPVKGLSEFLQVGWSLIHGVVLATLAGAVDFRFLIFTAVMRISENNFCSCADGRGASVGFRLGWFE
jgi:hypothetical protein